LNVDLAPTLAELAGVDVPVPIDGRRLAGWPGDPQAGPSRGSCLIEYWRKDRFDGVGYTRHVSDGNRLRLFFCDPRAQSHVPAYEPARARLERRLRVLLSSLPERRK
jgi:arylsulfatase A-like enzyme